MSNPIDKLMAADCIKAEVDAIYKEAKREADDYLAEARDTMGVTALKSKAFPEGGEFKYGQTRAKTVVEYNLADGDAFAEWNADNAGAAHEYVGAHAEAFAKWWFEATGELPEGIARVEYQEPPAITAPKIYKQNRESVKKVLLENGGLLEGANRFLLGESDE